MLLIIAFNGRQIQLLNFACIFGIRCSSFTICIYICNSTFKFPIQFLHSNCRFDIVCFAIQHCSLKYSTFKFTQLNIQVYAILHSTFENACFRYPTASQSMTVSVGSENYQNSLLLGGHSTLDSSFYHIKLRLAHSFCLPGVSRKLRPQTPKTQTPRIYLKKIYIINSSQFLSPNISWSR